MGKSFFWKGVIFGAIAGGALSMLDRNTRQSVITNCKKATNEVSFYVKNPGEAVSQVKEMTNKIKSTVEQVNEDISFIAGKVEELSEGTPHVVEFVENTKNTFNSDEKDSTSND